MTKLKHLPLLALTSTALMMATAFADTPKYKMTTDIPSSITAPDSVETSIGTMKFFDGVPDAASVAASYDFLDRSRAVNVFINSIPMMSAYMLREGQASMGADASNKIAIWDNLMDSKTIC